MLMTLANTIRNVAFLVVIPWHRAASFGQSETDANPLTANRLKSDPLWSLASGGYRAS